ncbi:dUTP diphosphatase [Bacillus altitudinis]|uniref:dUTP diphosphatase n=1 Tax=Bacillus altitudinis TaxID=293387 RepID=UPI0020BF2CFD|nr:deoxyuridine 5'-triphosphate nucleotidohydrolase [Bacillus altitudinis]
MNVNIKRLSADATTPTYAHSTDACFDLYASADVIIEPGEMEIVHTGLAFEIPEGCEMQIRPRSGITLKTPLQVQLGTVDSGYRGDVSVLIYNSESEKDEYCRHIHDIRGERTTTRGQYYAQKGIRVGTYIVRKGDRIAQALIQPVKQVSFTEVEELSSSDRGAGGFGSSGV